MAHESAGVMGAPGLERDCPVCGARAGEYCDRSNEGVHVRRESAVTHAAIEENHEAIRAWVERYAPKPPEGEQEDPYATLRAAFDAAYAQAAEGKGRKRHAAPLGTELPFDEQPIMRLAELYGLGFLVGQAAKKGHEAVVLEREGRGEAAREELSGAIVYLAAAWSFVGW